MSRKVKNINPLVQKIFQENDIQNIADAQSLMKDMFKYMVSLMLEAEMDETLGEVELDIPRDREGTFEPQVVPKYFRDISDIENKIISRYGRGMSTTDINNHLEEICGMSFSSTQINRITDKVMDEAKQRKSKKIKTFKSLLSFYFSGCNSL